MNDITSLFDSLLRSMHHVDMAFAEFKRMIDDDPVLHAQYAEWCDETGHTERRGFLDYAEEYIENQNSVWDSLTDYDAES